MFIALLGDGAAAWPLPEHDPEKWVPLSGIML
jgi:hypothetical protein